MMFRLWPFAGPVLAATAGIVSANYFGKEVYYFLSGLCVGTLVIIYFWKPSAVCFQIARNRVFYGLVMVFFLCLFGWRTIAEESKNVDQLPEGVFGRWSVTLITAGPYGIYGKSAWAEADTFEKDGISYEVKGQILIQAGKEDRSLWREGQKIRFWGNMIPLKKGKNDGFYQYLLRNGIRHQVRIKSSEVIGFRGGIRGYFLKIRHHFENRFYQYISSEREAGLGIALMTGERSYLSSELKTAYAGSGLSHLIALSGSHIAVLLLVMELFYRLFRRFLGVQEWLLNGLLAIVLVGYLILTGGSASVFRAVVMGLLFLAGRTFYLKGNSTNLMFFAGFVQLWFRPSDLYDAGFQLSYLAVLGILEFYVPFRRYFLSFFNRIRHALFRNIVLFIIDSAGVTLTATLLTFPLTVYYFGSFPVYFFPANLAASLPVSLATVTGFIFLLTTEFMYLNEFVGFILYKQLNVLNEIAVYFSGLPASVYMVKWNAFQAMGLYMIIAAIGLWVKFGLKNWKERSDKRIRVSNWAK